MGLSYLVGKWQLAISGHWPTFHAKLRLFLAYMSTLLYAMHVLHNSPPSLAGSGNEVNSQYQSQLNQKYDEMLVPVKMRRRWLSLEGLPYMTSAQGWGSVRKYANYSACIVCGQTVHKTQTKGEGAGVVKKSQNFADIVYGSPLASMACPFARAHLGGLSSSYPITKHF